MPLPNEGTGNLPSDQGGRYFVGGWDGAAFQAFRVDANKNLRGVIYDANGNVLFSTNNPGQVAVTSLPGGVGSLPAAAAMADAAANPTTAPVDARLALYNGSTWDRLYNNIQATALVSAARTGNVSSAVLTNYNARGVAALLNLTAISAGTPAGLRVNLLVQATGGAEYLVVSGSPVAAVGQSIWMFYPGINTGGLPSFNYEYAASVAVPRNFILQVSAGDGLTYTYSLDYALLS